MTPVCDPRILFFDSIAAEWDTWHDRAALAGRLDAEFDALAVGPSERVLDVGCGTGNLTLVLLGRLGSEGRVSALDPAPAMLERAREKIGDPRVTWVLAAADRLPFENRSHDRILCFSAWPHFEDPLAVVREFRRVLRSDGYVHILHLISRDEVNRIHAQAHPSVSADVLLPVGEVAALFGNEGFTVLTMVDDACRYLLTARKDGP